MNVNFNPFSVCPGIWNEKLEVVRLRLRSVINLSANEQLSRLRDAISQTWLHMIQIMLMKVLLKIRHLENTPWKHFEDKEKDKELLQFYLSSPFHSIGQTIGTTKISLLWIRFFYCIRVFTIKPKNFIQLQEHQRLENKSNVQISK